MNYLTASTLYFIFLYILLRISEQNIRFSLTIKYKFHPKNTSFNKKLITKYHHVILLYIYFILPHKCVLVRTEIN